MPTPLLVAVVGVAGALLGAFINNYFSSRNSRRDREQRELQAERDRQHRELQAQEEREHRERMAHLEDWRRQRDDATQLVRSSDPAEQKRGFAWLRTLENDPVAPQKDREFVQQIRELALEGMVGRAMFEEANTVLAGAEDLPVELEPMSALPIDAVVAEMMSQSLRDIRDWMATGGQQMRAEGIQLYGGLPPDQQVGNQKFGGHG